MSDVFIMVAIAVIKMRVSIMTLIRGIDDAIHNGHCNGYDCYNPNSHIYPILVATIIPIVLIIISVVSPSCL